MVRPGLWWSGRSAAAGTAASVMGKFALDRGQAAALVSAACGAAAGDGAAGQSCRRAAELPVRGALLLLLLLLNSAMLDSLVRAMREMGTARATVVGNALSFALAGIAGSALFAEQVPPLWWAGLAMVLAGVALIASEPDGQPAEPPPGEAHRKRE